MSLFILDTDTWTLFWHAHPIVTQGVQAEPQHLLAVTVVTVEEQLSGWYSALRQARQRDEKARAYQRLTQAVTNLKLWQILSFPETAMLRYEQLVALKLNVGKKDLAIAAIALEHNATVVTRNLRDFQRVPGLAVEDWSV